MGAADRNDVALLLRRAGFGATGAEIDAASAAGFDATVDAVVGSLTAPDAAADKVPAPPLTAPAPLGAGASTEQRQARNADLRQQATAIVDWLVARMLVASHPATEKFAWFWHGHFATSIDKVKRADLMYRQNQIFRQLGAGDFTTLTTAVGQDPAMLVWLDADTDVAAHPNENFARELMELFTLGIGNYTEQDVKEAARTFTGWSFDRTTLAFTERTRLHDAGDKTLLGQTGSFDGTDTIRLATTSPAAARFVAARIWSRYATAITPADPVAADLATTWQSERRGDAMLRAVFTHPQFRTDAVRAGLVKQPIEWVIGALRSFGLTADMSAAGGPKVAVATRTVLAGLGQTPFRPPSVGGWPADEAWLNTAADQIKLRFARVVSAAAAATPAGKALAATAAGDRPAHLAWLLGLDGWQPPTAAALATVAADPISLVVFGLTSPDYQLA
jgi:uncharacterized protein (DUF1800 family)